MNWRMPLADRRPFASPSRRLRARLRFWLAGAVAFRADAELLAAEGLADGLLVWRDAGRRGRQGRAVEGTDGDPAHGAFAVGHADGDGQRVGRVIRFGQLGQAEDGLDHALDL